MATLFQGKGIQRCGLQGYRMEDNEIVPLQNISRKVMVSVEDTDRPTYVVIAFTKRIFPVNAATVVVPSYPLKMT